MTAQTYNIVHSILFVVALALAGCGEKTSQAPPKQMVQDTVRASLPPFLSLDSIELEPISTGPESVKVNFKAIVTPKEDLCQIDREVEGTPKVTLLKVVQAAGTKASLYGSVEARRTMDQWTLESPEIKVGLKQFGAPRGAFHVQSYVTGSNEANAALRQQAANAAEIARARKAAQAQRELERKAREEQQAREEKAREAREEQARIALEAQQQKEMEQRKKEEEQRQKQRQAAYQKLILATAPKIRYIGTVAYEDRRRRLRLVFTEQKDLLTPNKKEFLISAEVSNPDMPREKQIFTGNLVQHEIGKAVVYPIVLRSVTKEKATDNTWKFFYWGGVNWNSA